MLISRRGPSCEKRPRKAFTLAEVLVTLTLSALVLGIAVSVGAKLQHRLLAESTRLADDEQLASAAQLVPLDLRPEVLDFVVSRWERHCKEQMLIHLALWVPDEAQLARPN